MLAVGRKRGNVYLHVTVKFIEHASRFIQPSEPLTYLKQCHCFKAYLASIWHVCSVYVILLRGPVSPVQLNLHCCIFIACRPLRPISGFSKTLIAQVYCVCVCVCAVHSVVCQSLLRALSHPEKWGRRSDIH